MEIIRIICCVEGRYVTEVLCALPFSCLQDGLAAELTDVVKLS